MSFTEEEKDSIRIVSWDCIKSFKETHLAELCDLKHKEVADVHDKISKVDKKLSWFFGILLVALLGFFISSSSEKPKQALTKEDIKEIVNIVIQQEK